MMATARAFSHGRFTHGPSTALSLHKSRRNTEAEGSSTPARACTTMVMMPKGARGMSTIAPATHDQAAEGRVEAGSLEQVPVQGVMSAEEVTHRVRRPQGHRGRPDDRGVQEHDGVQDTCTVPEQMPRARAQLLPRR